MHIIDWAQNNLLVIFFHAIFHWHLASHFLTGSALQSPSAVLLCRPTSKKKGKFAGMPWFLTATYTHIWLEKLRGLLIYLDIIHTHVFTSPHCTPFSDNIHRTFFWLSGLNYLSVCLLSLIDLFLGLSA